MGNLWKVGGQANDGNRYLANGKRRVLLINDFSERPFTPRLRLTSRLFAGAELAMGFVQFGDVDAEVAPRGCECCNLPGVTGFSYWMKLSRWFPRCSNSILASLPFLGLWTILHAESPAATVHSAHWPQWRGPAGDGTVTASNPPLEWSETSNILWKTPLPWWSGSTPVVWGDRIFLVTPVAPGERSEDSSSSSSGSETAPRPGREPGPGGIRPGGRGGGRFQNPGGLPETGARLNPGGTDLHVLCLHRQDGSLLWSRAIDNGNTLHRKHNNTSPSPVTDGERVWILTGNGVLTCLDMDGTPHWVRRLADEYGAFGQNHGYGSSPLLHEDWLVVPVLHGMRTDKPSYLLAVDKATGKTLWRTERKTPAERESPDAYVTPQLYRNDKAHRLEVIVNGGDVVTSHDLRSGKELWRADVLNPNRAGNYRIVPSCVVVGDIIVAPTRENPLTALRAGGNGDVTATHVLWQFAAGPDVPTPVSDGTYLWTLSGSRSQLSCLDVRTGRVLYDRERLPSGTYSSSPVLCGDRLYIPNESGTTVVVAASPEFKVLAVNTLDDAYTLSSPVIVGDQLLLRTGSHLYLIGQSAPETP